MVTLLHRAGPVLVLVALLNACSGGSHAAPPATAPADRSPPPTHLSGQDSGLPVRWVDAPVPTPDPRKLAAALPACRASQLTGDLSPSGGGAGTEVYRSQITSRSDSVCALRGYPQTLFGETTTGTVVRLRPEWLAGGSAYVSDQPAVLPPGGSAGIAFLTGDSCFTPGSVTSSFSALVIGLASGDVVARTTGGAAVFPCGLAETPFARWVEGEGGPDTSPGRLGLLATLPSSFSVTPGQRRLDYLLTLTNPTEHPIGLRPCPSYTESFTLDLINGVKGLGVRTLSIASFRLNCSAAPEIAAEGSVTFDMRLALPATLGQVSGGSLLWRLNVIDGTGPEATSNWCAAC